MSLPPEPGLYRRTVALTEEVVMRKLVAGLMFSLDGVVESPEKWARPYFNGEMQEVIDAGVAQADAILLGRRTYLEFAELWPNQGSEVPLADFMNETPKYVVSSTLDSLEWGPSSLLRGDLAEEVGRLKRQAGNNIQISGSPRLVRSLLRDGLLDELSIMLVPIVVGSGMRLFDDMTDQVALELVESRALGTGMLSVTYQPASA
jgi:dihydrofolate reductase